MSPAVYTGGTFDLFHVGHVNLLRGCRELAGPHGWVTVSLNTDAFISAYKGRPPVIGYEDRAAVLRACRYVDEVIPNVGGADSRAAILEAKPDLIVIGSDWKNRNYHAQMGFTPNWLVEHRIEIVYLPYTEHVSSSMVRERL